MKAIAVWSNQNIMKARALIVIGRLLMYGLAFYIGTGLQSRHFSFHPLWLFISFFLLISILYKFSTPYRSFPFQIRKLLDVVVVYLSFVTTICFTNLPHVSGLSLYSPLNGSFTSKITGEKPKTGFKELKKQWKELKKMAKKQRGASTGGILLAILAGVTLGLLLAMGACSLACNGNDALAVAVLLGGLAAIFFICRLIIRQTSRDKIKHSGNPANGALLSLP